MSDFLKKISLYDILSMLIPGGVIYIFLLLTQGFALKLNENKIDPTLGWIVSLTVSYLLGLINHSLTSLIWSPFRNNFQMIKCAGIKYGNLKYVDNDRNEPCWFCTTFAKHKISKKILAAEKAMQRSPCVLFLVYLSSGIIVTICIFTIFRQEIFSYVDYIFMPFFVFAIITFCQFVSCIKGESQHIVKKGIIEDYYQRYYYVATHSYRKDMFVIEGQVAFMQSMLIPIFCLLLLPDYKYDMLLNCGACSSAIKVILCLIVIFSIPAIFCRQMKIYQCVFEDYKFLPREQDNKREPKKFQR